MNVTGEFDKAEKNQGSDGIAQDHQQDVDQETDAPNTRESEIEHGAGVLIRSRIRTGLRLILSPMFGHPLRQHHVSDPHDARRPLHQDRDDLWRQGSRDGDERCRKGGKFHQDGQGARESRE